VGKGDRPSRGGSAEASDLIDGLTQISPRGLREGRRAFSETLASSIVVRSSAKSREERKSADRRRPQDERVKRKRKGRKGR